MEAPLDESASRPCTRARPRVLPELVLLAEGARLWSAPARARHARHPQPRMRRPETRLVLTSATLLFTELLLIRWIPAQLVYVGFFNNFVLIASFLGIGVGILLSRRRPDIGPWVGSIPLLALVALVFSNQLNAWIPVQRGGEVFLGFSEGRQVEVDVAVLGGVVLLVTAAMAGFALPLGPLLASMPPLRAYSFDVLGSISGVAGFAALSALDTPPLVWFALLAA